MNKNILVSVIVAIYKDIEALDLILESLYNQTYKGKYEVIVAEDGQDDTVKKYISSLNYSNLVHTTQKDEGWRKNKSLNNAIRNSKGELLIFLDGDCIPYSNLIENYVKQQEEKTILCGRRVELGERYSTNIRKKLLNIRELEEKYLKNYFKLIKDKSRHFEEGIKLNNFFYNLRHNNKTPAILGCNFAVNKKDIYEINGFDENYHWPSVGEDTDIEFRLKKNNCKTKSVRNLSIVVHLYHKITYSQENNKLANNYFNEIKNTNSKKCKHGLF